MFKNTNTTRIYKSQNYKSLALPETTIKKTYNKVLNNKLLAQTFIVFLYARYMHPV